MATRAQTTQLINIEPCLEAQHLATFRMDNTLDMFRKPQAQKTALLEITKEGGCVTVAQVNTIIVGYGTFHHPSDIESWGEDRTGKLIELGAVEVSEHYRGQKLAERLLQATFATGKYDDTIVFATMYFWHYDLKRTGLSDFAYKRLLEKLYRKAGMVPFATTDPEIKSSAANQLMARVGPHTPADVRAEFDRLRLRPVLELY
ncbi:MAG: GNAT family N-acetyltransferase [Trueperaceae bacterium]